MTQAAKPSQVQCSRSSIRLPPWLTPHPFPLPSSLTTRHLAAELHQYSLPIFGQEQSAVATIDPFMNRMVAGGRAFSSITLDKLLCRCMQSHAHNAHQPFTHATHHHTHTPFLTTQRTITHPSSHHLSPLLCVYVSTMKGLLQRVRDRHLRTASDAAATRHNSNRKEQGPQEPGEHG